MFNSINKRKELIDRELEVYKKERLIEIEKSVTELYRLGAEQNHEFEHEFHSKRQKLNTELAVLEAKKSTYVSNLEMKIENYVAEYKAVNNAKDKTIEILEKALKELTAKIPTSINQTLITK